MSTGEALTLSPIELASALGIGRTRIYKALKAGVIPCLRAGKKFRVPRRVLDDLLADPEGFNRRQEAAT